MLYTFLWHKEEDQKVQKIENGVVQLVTDINGEELVHVTVLIKEKEEKYVEWLKNSLIHHKGKWLDMEGVIRYRKRALKLPDPNGSLIGQKRLFPTKLRRLRFEMAKALGVYAITQEKNVKDIAMSEEMADNWNKYFESKGETEILGEKPVKTYGIGRKELEEFGAVEVNEKNLGEKQSNESTEIKEKQQEELDSFEK